MKHIFFSLSVLLALTLVVLTSCKKNNSGNNGQASLAGKWQQTNGPCNGLIESVAIKGTTIFAGGAQGGMYISRDLGKSWSQVTNGISIYASVTAILIHNDTIMAAGDGIYRSTNSGQTWTQLGNDLYFSDLRAMAWIGNRIMLCTDYWGSLYISDDNGYTWNQCPEHVPDYYVSGATILGKDIFVSSDVNGIYKSIDNGQTYTLSNNGLTSVHVYTLETNGNKIYASTGDGLFVSSDHGTTWTIISNVLFNIQGINHLVFDGSTILAGGYTGLIFSMDDGVTWKQAVNGLSDPRIESLAVSGSTFLAGTPSGVYMSVNSGQTWSANGLPITFVSSLSSNGSDVFACASQMTGGIFTTPDFGQNWNFMFGGIPTYNVGSIAWNGADMLAATDSGVFVSADRGLTWTKKSHGIPVDEYSTVTCVAGDGTNLYAGTYSYGLFVSHDGGNSWTHSTLPVEDNKYAMCLYVKGSSVYAATFFGGVLFSSDNGQTWISRSSGLPSLTGYTSIVQFGSQLFISSLGGVYFSGDEGHTWVSAGNELTGKVIYSLATNGSILIAAAADNGVYMSRDQGGSWFSVNYGLPAKTRAMCVAVNGSWLFVGTDGQGVWRHPLGN
ncbi:MAG: hypothetical protein ABSE72_04755 [Bacteroidales bacterium]|jgi:ligand-binding sensor domain-containing protein